MTTIQNPHLRAMLEQLDKDMPPEIQPERKSGPPYEISPANEVKRKPVSVRDRKDKSLAAVKLAHKEAFSRPLIDAALVTDAERRDIANRVKGAVHWRGIAFSGGAQ